jgi:AcrR family transcriptional regulator
MDIGIRQERGETTAEKIIRAARDLFQRDGVEATSMASIARSANVSRQTVYDAFSTRENLIAKTILARCEELGELFRRTIEDNPACDEALVEVVTCIVDVSRDDVELRRIWETTPNFQVHDLMTGRLSEVRPLTISIFAPLFERARAQGLLRLDANDDEISDWIRGVCMMLIMRRDLNRHEERALVRRYLLPAVMTTPVPSATAVELWRLLRPSSEN